jgi:hypothetical protein
MERSNEVKGRMLKIVATIALICFLLIGVWVVTTPCPATLHPWNAPGYVESVWPPATSKTLINCSTTKGLGYIPEAEIEVGIGINMDSIWDLEMLRSNTEDLPPFPDRVILYVDGEQVPITKRAEGGGAYFIGDTELDLAGWYFLGSNHFVHPGDHQAKIMIATRSGKTLEFEWHFIKK